MISDTDRVLMELWPNWIPTGEESALWSESLSRFSMRVATQAIRIHRTKTQYPTPTLAQVLEIARSIVNAEAEAARPRNASAEHAAMAERCRQDAEGHRMLVDSLTTEEIAGTVKRLQAKLGKVLGTMCDGPASQWSKVECGFFAAQYDIDLREATIAASRGELAHV